MHLVPAKWSSYEVINAVVNNSILQGGQLAYLVVKLCLKGKLHKNVETEYAYFTRSRKGK